MPSTDIPWPTSAVEAWDTLHLGPPGKVEAFPGLATIKIKGGVEVQRNKSKNRKGESIKVQGLKAVDLDISLRIWTKEQNTRLNVLFPLIAPSDATEPLEIAHPTATNRGVAQIKITDLDGPDITKGPYREYKIKAVQYLPEPDKPVGGAVKGKSGTTQADLTALVAEKLKQVALQFQRALKSPRTPEDEAFLTVTRQKINDLDEQINAAQAKLGGDKLPPTAPKPAPTGVATGTL